MLSLSLSKDSLFDKIFEHISKRLKFTLEIIFKLIKNELNTSSNNTVEEDLIFLIQKSLFLNFQKY